MADRTPEYDERLALTGDEIDRLVRRLRSLTGGAWRSRETPVRAALSELVELAQRAEDVEPHRLPDLPVFALGDAVAVVAGDALAALGDRPDEAVLDRLLSTVRAALTATR